MQTEFLQELEREANVGRVLMVRLPEEKLDWRIHEKAKTLGELAWHMASIPGVVSEILQSTRQDRTQVAWPATPSSVLEMVAGFDASVEKAKANLGKLSDDDMEMTLTMLAGERQLFAMPRKQFARWGMVTHFVHHRAQLGVYFRVLDLAVPSLVGPSLDENPFAPRV